MLSFLGPPILDGTAMDRILEKRLNDDDDELILHCDTATEGCVSNDFFRHSLDDSPASYLR